MNKNEYNKQYYIDNKIQIDARHRKYKLEHEEQERQYRKNNTEHIKKKNTEYYLTHRKEIREQHRQYCNVKRGTNIKFNLNDRMTTLIYVSLRSIKANRHWEKLVNYTLKELKCRLGLTMPIGYTWQDYLEGKLHIDHIIPVSVFNYNKPEHIDFKRCWALKNLQLLSAKENLIKSKKITKPFQPALALNI